MVLRGPFTIPARHREHDSAALKTCSRWSWNLVHDTIGDHVALETLTTMSRNMQSWDAVPAKDTDDN